ncbi:MAG: VOC family protein [bacterium]|nr:VOC family protein [bacterium]
MKLRYEHMHLIHADHDAAVKFYQDVLDAKILNTIERHGAPQTKLDVSGTMLIVRGIRPGEDPAAAGALPRMGVDHMGFYIAKGEWEEAKQRLEDNNVEILDEGDLPHLRYLYFAAPDGVVIEFMESK